MKRLCLTLLLLLCCGSILAQQKGKITVSIIDSETKEGVQGAVVEVAPVSNPDNKKYYTSGYGGKVEITSLDYGEYTAVTTFLGYADLENKFKVAAASQDLGKWELVVSATRIDTVVKEVKALRTSQDGDTLSYNAGAFKVSNDADVEGLLKKMPGITIKNGEVEAQGETVKKIFVDGKEFFGDDVSTAIKSLPAQAVDRIEVYNKLSDQAEFSGMDDGEGFKALNIVTRPGMRQGQFGKLYAGYGYQPETDEITSNHKYIAGGNVNFFQGDSRVSLLGLFNNINQQNFSFEDILGVTGGGGRGGGGVGGYMVRPQSGVASVNALGINYSDLWGKKDQVKFQGSYFFNNTRTKNLSFSETWYESPAPVDTLYRHGSSNTLNNNHRLNARLDWTISENQSLMSRTGFSYQNNSPYSSSYGYQFGESGLLYNEDYGKTTSSGWNLNEFLQYRVRLGKAGRTMTVDGSFRYSDNSSRRNISSNNAQALPYGDADYDDYRDLLGDEGRGSIPDVTHSPLYDPIFQYITAPSRTYNVRGSIMYNEPLGKYFQLSLSYRVNYQNSNRDQKGYFADSNFENWAGNPNPEMTNAYQSGYWKHNVGPGIRYSKDKNTFVASVSYQRSSLDGSVIGGQNTEVKRDFDNVTYFAMANYAFNRENTLRIFFRSSTDAPSVSQLQNIFDVSTPQYLSIGNKDLIPAFTHSINFHYINSNVEKGRTFMWMFMMNHQQNYISSSTWYNQGGITDVNVNGESYRPQRVTSYENMDGYWMLRTHMSLGLPLSFMKCNLNLMAGVNYNIIPSAIYGSLEDMYKHIFTTNKAKNIGYDLNVTLGSNISENIDFTLSWNGGYNQAWNTAAVGNGNNKNNYFSHTASGALKWVFWKGFTFTANCSYVQYLGFTNDYNESYVLCNLFVGKKLFKNKLGEIQVGVNDVANQNTAFTRSTGSGFTQNSWNSVIGRYYSVQFVYNLRHFGKKGSSSMKDYDYNESGGGVGMNRGGGGGMRPMGPPPGR